MESFLRQGSHLVEEARKRRPWFIFLDFDGTLVPIVRRPEWARMPAATKQVLRNLARLPGTHVAVVSGRALSDIRRKVGLADIGYVGNHGLEIAYGEKRFRLPEAARHRPFLKRLADSLALTLARQPGAQLEWKGLSASLHWRGMPRERQARFRRAVLEALKPLDAAGKIRLAIGKQVAEIRPPLEWDKGAAVRWLLKVFRSRKRKGEPFVVFVGDDRTDEDAFRAINAMGGRSVLVSVRGRPSLARFRLRDPDAVRLWLEFAYRTLSRADKSRRVKRRR